MKHPILVCSVVFLALIVGCVPEHFRFDREFGKAGSGRGEFLSATDLALTSDGHLVVSDSGNNRFQIIDAKDGSMKLAAGEYGTTGFKLQGIAGLGLNPVTDEIWVCDQRGNKLVKFDRSGNPMLRVVDKMKFPIDVAVDRQGNVYVLMSKQPQIYKFDSNGKFLETIGGAGKSALIFATSIVFHQDHLFVADYGGRRVLKLDSNGQFVSEFDKKGDFEEMRGPSSIFLDEAGNMYLLDLGEVPVVMLSPKGELISKVGSFGNERGQFLYPRGIVALSNKEVLVLDNSRNVVLSFAKKPS
jgi:DNA-binding beta-propeller fold protein YncE